MTKLKIVYNNYTSSISYNVYHAMIQDICTIICEFEEKGRLEHVQTQIKRGGNSEISSLHVTVSSSSNSPSSIVLTVVMATGPASTVKAQTEQL